MPTFASDTFTRAVQNLETYSASWVQHPSFTAALRLMGGGRVRPAAASSTGVYYHTATPAKS